MNKPLFLFLLCVLLSGCRPSPNGSQTAPPHPSHNAVYYWKTVFCPDSAELNFLTEHNIKRIYLRFFDVVEEDLYRTGKTVVIPNATVQFKSAIPPCIESVVPTVYITLDALKKTQKESSIGDLSEKIVRRVLNMMSYHLIPNVTEIQLDCDWTESTQQTYFDLCAAVQEKIHDSEKPDMRVSSTIRLHQLNQAAPPVDYGVLMVYNTGAFKNPHTRNSILDYADVASYLRKTIHYPLPLDVAYPTYEWTLWYRNGVFKGIVKDSSALLECLPDDTLRKECSDIQTLLQVKQLIEEKVLRNQPESSVILYHLDNKNLSKYTSDEITGLYSHTAVR